MFSRFPVKIQLILMQCSAVHLKPDTPVLLNAVYFEKCMLQHKFYPFYQNVSHFTPR